MNNPPATGGRDDTTRYLCAAAHLDQTFADDAIREFLVEPTRAVPPAPGVNAPAVLAEAVAARARRKVRDATLVALAVVALVFASWLFLGLWAVVAVGATIPAAKSEGWVSTVKRLAPLVAVVAIGVAAYLFVGESVTSVADAGSDAEAVAGIVLSIVAIIGVFVVLLVDEFVVANHINTRFRRGRTVGDVVVRPDQRPVLTFAAKRFLTQLGRHLRGPAEPMAPGRTPAQGGDGGGRAPAPVVVSRGFNPFVGAGEPHKPWSFAVPLKPVSNEPAKPLTAAVLYGRIYAAVVALRSSAYLSPGRRFAELNVTEQIVVSAEELIDHDATARDFLADHTVPPYPWLRGERVWQLRDDPQEWARYYLCFQVETWDRDFVVSIYVHLAVSADTLYVEWTPCVLLPIRAWYRRIDAMPMSLWSTVVQSLAGLAALPVTLPRRFAGLFSRIRPLPRQRGVISADMFGVLWSLRERAADSDVHNYFQRADLDRYVKVLESRFTLAIIAVLKDAGYSVAGLEQRVEAVENNNLFINNSGNVAIGGRANRVGNVTKTGTAS
ncbi:hypothetical protein [Actinophytocola sp.]|uniref:hypothetical protein n=1 Tax=Actinophytocola sp. TaxID=1872138 RepID=UPI003D6C61A4